MKTRVVVLVGCISLASALAGCTGGGNGTASEEEAVASASTTAVPTITHLAELPEDYHAVTASDAHIRFGLPKGWVDVDLGAEDLEAGLAALGITGDQLDSMRTAIQALSESGAVFWIDALSIQKSSGHYATNINVVCSDAPGVDTISRLETTARIGVAQIGGENIETDRIKIAGRDAVRSSYDLAMGKVAISGSQLYWIPTSDQACGLTLSTDRPKAYRTIFETILQTVSFAA